MASNSLKQGRQYHQLQTSITNSIVIVTNKVVRYSHLISLHLLSMVEAFRRIINSHMTKCKIYQDEVHNNLMRSLIIHHLHLQEVNFLHSLLHKDLSLLLIHFIQLLGTSLNYTNIYNIRSLKLNNKHNTLNCPMEVLYLHPHLLHRREYNKMEVNVVMFLVVLITIMEICLNRSRVMGNKEVS